MRVVHVNAYDGNGGAGRAMMRLHRALKKEGVQSDALCLYQFNPGTDVTPVYRNWWGKLRAVINIFAERYLVKLLRPRRGVPFSLQWMGLPIHRHPLVRQADIIHLHWVNHGMLAPPQMKKLFKLKKKVVWSLHDSNPLTGGCHVRYDCRFFEQSCGRCPVLGGRRSNDWSRRSWQAKAEAYRGSAITWVAPSSWMGESARRASLSAGSVVEVIGNALDTDLFYPGSRGQCRARLGIDADAFVLLAGYMPSSTDRHKGKRELQAALAQLRELPGIDHRRILLVFFGAGDDAADKWPYPCHYAGKIDSEESLVAYYSAADVFLFPSLQESLGYTALESLACGTPVVAFETSGVTDVVLHRKNGYLAPLGDIRQFAAGIEWIYRHRHRAELAGSGIAHASENFSLRVIARKHMALYRRLLEG